MCASDVKEPALNTKPVRVAVDIMGGDHAPDAILKGCVLALDELPPGDKIVMVGRGRVIREFLDERSIAFDDPRIEIVDAEQVIEMGESASLGVRRKTDSSIVKMHQMGGKDHPQRCDVVLSAGNTGACVAAATLLMRRLPNVIRPGIAVTVPAFHGPVVLTDAGANPEPKPEHLWQYGLMADVLARRVLRIANPRVALMNIGSEEAKGTGLIKQTRDLLKATPGLNYIGYIEGRDFFDGVADVVVTDGLVGNTLLKAAEGMAKSLFKAIATELLEYDVSLVAKFEPVVKRIYAKNDYHEHGGAPLLGVNGACFIAHGSSEARTIRAAIKNCRTFVRAGVNEAIVERLAEIERHNVPELIRQANGETADEGVRV
ncbi:glycerol-3-phosphate acyltransferase PlsX [Phycisphaerales bacterium]|nr:glycerol-3-phosphate acyltransferase PlsX [Phycisphaerales bacterium]